MAASSNDTGALPNGWRLARLGDVAEWVNGLAFRDIQFSETGKPVIRIAEIKEGISTQTKFTKQSFDESVHIHPGDLLFAWSGQPETSINAFWWNGPEGWLNQHIFRVTTRSQVSTTFFYHLLRHLNPLFVRIAQGKQTTGLGHVTKEELFKVVAALPPLGEQRAIAAVLNAIDDAIEYTEAVIAATERLRDALLHELLTRGVPGWHSEWKEAPGIGTIPADWEVVRLGEVCNEIYRYPTYYNVEYVQQGVLEVRGELIEENGKLPRDPSLYRRISPEFSSRFVRTQLKEGDFVLTVRGTVGKVGYVHEGLAGANMTANLLRISSIRSKLSPTWLKYVLVSDRFQSRLQSIVTRTTIDTVTAPDVKAVTVHLPNMEEQQAIASALDGVDEAIEKSRQEHAGLQLLKASAADALLSGRVRVGSDTHSHTLRG